MPEPVRILLAISAFAVFAAGIGYFSRAPVYSYADPSAGVIKVSLSRATARIEPCVQLTPEEIARLSPNMRREMQCERERRPLALEVSVDGERLVAIEQAPSGIWNDGAVSIYSSHAVAAGEHRLTVRLREAGPGIEDWSLTMDEDVVIEAGRYYTLTYRDEDGRLGFQ